MFFEYVFYTRPRTFYDCSYGNIRSNVHMASARYVHVKNWNLLFYCSNIAKSENAMLWRMLSQLETCIVYCCIWTVTLAKSIAPRKTWRKLWHSYISKLFLTKMQVKFSIFHATIQLQNRKLSSRISLQNRLFCLCRLPAVLIIFFVSKKVNL
jgi:hypothetical protein